MGTHTIRMEVVPGDSAAITAELQECVLELNTLYRRILMVTGTQPDLFRDYALEKEIPGLREEMTAVRDRLQAAYENIQASSGIRDGDTANIDRLVVQLDGFLKDVDTIPQRLSNFSSNISSLSAWMLNLKKSAAGNRLSAHPVGRRGRAEGQRPGSSRPCPTWRSSSPAPLSWITTPSEILPPRPRPSMCGLASGRDQVQIIQGAGG